jgi:hypothetical protein
MLAKERRAKSHMTTKCWPVCERTYRSERHWNLPLRNTPMRHSRWTEEAEVLYADLLGEHQLRRQLREHLDHRLGELSGRDADVEAPRRICAK